MALTYDPIEDRIGRPTSVINAANPDMDMSLPWDEGDTIGEGRSTSPEEAQRYLDEAIAKGYSEEDVRSFLERNPGDYYRIDEALESDYDEDNGSNNPGGGRSPSPQDYDNGDLYPRDGGSAASAAQLQQILDAIMAANQGPDVDLSMIDPGAFPEFTVPGENLSPAIDDTLLDLMEFGIQDPFGMQQRLRALLDETAGGGNMSYPMGGDWNGEGAIDLFSRDGQTVGSGVNQGRLQNRLEAARENLTRGQVGALSDLRGVLADRGLLGTEGAPEGAELDTTVRTFEPLQRAYLAEIRQAQNEESMLADEARLDALTRATGWSREQAATRLSSAQTAQQRQQMMADIALGQLDRNIEWNKFLAEFGLKREQVAYEIQNGRLDNIAPILSMFLTLLQQSRGGFI